MKGVQCYELFGGIALKNHTFSFSFLCSFNKENPLVAQSLRYIKFDHNKIFSAVKIARLSLIGSNHDNINVVRLSNQ